MDSLRESRPSCELFNGNSKHEDVTTKKCGFYHEQLGFYNETNVDVTMKNGDFTMKKWDFTMKIGDFTVKNVAQGQK